MAIPRICPHCQLKMFEFHFDENLNLLCKNCGKIAYPTSIESEEIAFPKSKKFFDKSEHKNDDDEIVP